MFKYLLTECFIDYDHDMAIKFKQIKEKVNSNKNWGECKKYKFKYIFRSYCKVLQNFQNFMDKHGVL